MNESRLVFGGGKDETVAVLQWSRAAAEIGTPELAKRLGVQPSTVQQYREGRRPNAGWLFVVRWLKACGFRVVIEREG